MQAQWMRLPLELRQRPQWLLAGPNEFGELKVPITVAFGSDDYVTAPGSSTNAATWLTFEDACKFAEGFGYGIGYVLSEHDPYCCVDLDVKDAENAPDEPDKWTTPERFDLFRRIVATLESYTERSRSGKGMHIWVRAGIGRGVKRDGVEIYSQERFIVCTGDVWVDLPIANRQAIIENAASQMRRDNSSNAEFVLVELEEEDDDATVWVRAAGAENKDKFKALCDGKWEELGYPSQSEADLSLMSMFTFYSKSNEQCRRMFRETALGKRKKATKDNRYIDYTLRVCRRRQAREQVADDHAKNAAAALAAQHTTRVDAPYRPPQAPIAAPVHATHDPSAAPAVGPAGGTAAALTTPPESVPGLDWPPGFAGALAGFIYRNAPRPVKEVAIVAALGWLAGVCGKCWQIPGSGLNLYIILIARSAVGKEAMHGGLGAFMSKLQSTLPTAGNFVDFNDYASGPALVKQCAQNQSFVNVSGEWGRKLRKLAQDSDRDGPMQTLRTAMTNLFQKSGATSVVGGIGYSNKEQNVMSVSGVAYSMIGESTPGTFYDALTESMMEDGFLSRFTIVEYTGDRPPMNTHPQFEPDPQLTEHAVHILVQAGNLLGSRGVIYVQRDSEAAELMDAFDKECDAQINSTTDESWRQMWNRAHLKMSRIAALLAVGDNHLAPVVNRVQVEWALKLVRHDIEIMQRRLESGEIGTTDNTRVRKLLAICQEWLHMQTVPPGYQIPQALRTAGIIPRKYFQIRVQRSTAFNVAKQGSSRAIDETIRSMIDDGYLAEVSKADAAEHYGFLGRCFRIVNIPNWASMREK